MNMLVVQQIRLRGMNTDDQVHEATTKRDICFLYFEIIDNRGTVVIFIAFDNKKEYCRKQAHHKTRLRSCILKIVWACMCPQVGHKVGFTYGNVTDIA